MVKLEFQDIDGGSVSLNLYSHFTCIYGKESGEGKSFFFSLIEEGINDGTIEVLCELPFTLATPATLEAILQVNDRHIVMIDEGSMLKEGLIKKVNTSHHLFVCISRSLPFKSEYPMRGLYKIVKDGSNLDIVEMDRLPLYDGNVNKEYKLVTESKEGRSEHELLNVYIDNIVSSNGVSRIERNLRNTTEDILVFADLGNIGRPYSLLLKRCKQNPNIRFYPYECFEQLLYESDFVREGSNIVRGTVFDYVSSEEYFEKLLERITRGTSIEYKHGKPLPRGYLDKDNFSVVFSGDVARKIKNYIIAKGYDK